MVDKVGILDGCHAPCPLDGLKIDGQDVKFNIVWQLPVSGPWMGDSVDRFCKLLKISQNLFKNLKFLLDRLGLPIKGRDKERSGGYGSVLKGCKGRKRRLEGFEGDGV